MSPHRSSEPQRLLLHLPAWPELTCSIPSTLLAAVSLVAVYTLPVPSHLLRLLAEVHLTAQDGGQTRETGVWAGRARVDRLWEPPRQGRWAGWASSRAASRPVSAVARGVVRPHGGGSCFPSGTFLTLEQRGPWRTGAHGAVQTAWATRQGPFLPSPCPLVAGPSLRTWLHLRLPLSPPQGSHR
mgnify:CR=1 FL=1